MHHALRGKGPSPVGRRRQPKEVGRLNIGARCFAVALFSDGDDERQDVTQFELGEFKLTAYEVASPVDEAADLTDDVIDRLTGRELEIAILVAQGHATKNIAHKLQISEWTVCTYIRRIFAKLNVYNRAGMVYRCASLIRRSAESVASDPSMT